MHSTSNGTPLQCSCLENPKDGGAWWAAVYWVAQSLTRLKRLSTSIDEIDKNKDLLNDTGNYTQYFIVSYMGKESENDSIYVKYKAFI